MMPVHEFSKTHTREETQEYAEKRKEWKRGLGVLNRMKTHKCRPCEIAMQEKQLKEVRNG